MKYGAFSNMAPRKTNIMGQPHMLAYINPQEEQALRNMGGAGLPGPDGIPSYYVDGEEHNENAATLVAETNAAMMNSVDPNHPNFDNGATAAALNKRLRKDDGFRRAHTYLVTNKSSSSYGSYLDGEKALERGFTPVMSGAFAPGGAFFDKVNRSGDDPTDDGISAGIEGVDFDTVVARNSAGKSLGYTTRIRPGS